MSNTPRKPLPVVGGSYALNKKQSLSVSVDHKKSHFNKGGFLLMVKVIVSRSDR